MEPHKGSSEGEDIPSDFFDDFAKEEFIEGLSVIDSWDDNDNQQKNSRINHETLDSVQDLRELIVRGSNQESPAKRSKKCDEPSSSNCIDNFIKPGSRRDPNKTNEAIKKDKELKVKQYLTKHLESSDDLLPPGTELDNFFEDKRRDGNKEPSTKSPTKYGHEASIQYIHTRKRRHSPFIYNNHTRNYRESPGGRESPGRHRDNPGRYRNSPGHYESSRNRDVLGRPRDYKGRNEDSIGRHRDSPGRRRDSPGRNRDSQGRRWNSPPRYSNSAVKHRDSPDRHHHSPGKYRDSPGRKRDFSNKYRQSDRYEAPNDKSHLSPKLQRNLHPSPSRKSSSSQKYLSGVKSSPSRKRHEESLKSPPRQFKRSGTPSNKKPDDFLYPGEPAAQYNTVNQTYEMEMKQSYPGATYTNPLSVMNGPLVTPGYNYPHLPAYDIYNIPFGYMPQSNIQPGPVPQPVPPPIIHPGMGDLNHAPNNSHLVTPVQLNLDPSKTTSAVLPSDALAKLVTDGKLSHEDYLKLAPNKGFDLPMDTHKKLGVLNRCHSAMTKLGDLVPPNRLKIGNLTEEPKSIAPRFCSPLKRQKVVDFRFTKNSGSAITSQNKRIVDTIVSTLNLNKLVGRPKKNIQENMKDVAVQTSGPHCEMCIIRKATLSNAVGTSIDREDFTSTVHTQVIEEDLYNSKSMFNPSGSIGGGAAMSIAHMTPAQLVSQLAARAKSLKQSDAKQNTAQSLDHQYTNRAPYDGRDQYNYRNNYNNYRY